MARTSRRLSAPVEAVFSVLSHPPNYGYFVVGTKTIRRFDPRWPQVDAVFHHTVGLGPLFLRDKTRVFKVEPPDHLILHAGMGPLSVNLVDFRLSPDPAGTVIVVEEYPIRGPLAKIWSPPLDAAMWLRNFLMLRRVERLAQRRAELAHL